LAADVLTGSGFNDFFFATALLVGALAFFPATDFFEALRSF
jgi:hypothetical protein